jgi:rhodanese-related sulfurtransferase
MVRTGSVAAILLLAASFFQPKSEDLRATGRSLYSSLCQRCHGETGDDVGYPGITPLSGITLRIPVKDIPTLSAPFVGRTFDGKEAEALIAHLETLKGEKGFDEPGYLFSPYLLEKKHGETGHYRIIDTRQANEYEARHIPNAVLWKPTSSPEETQKRLAILGVGPETFVVVYDDNGGAPAAAAWWAIRKAGHERVAVLDGGFQNWTNQSHPVSSSPSSFSSGSHSPTKRMESDASVTLCDGLQEKTIVLGDAAGGEAMRFDWRRTRNDNSLLPASEVRAYLESIGMASSARYSIRGTPEEGAYLVFLLHLLGRSPQVSPAGDSLCLPAESRAVNAISIATSCEYAEHRSLPACLSALPVLYPSSEGRKSPARAGSCSLKARVLRVVA